MSFWATAINSALCPATCSAEKLSDSTADATAEATADASADPELNPPSPLNAPTLFNSELNPPLITAPAPGDVTFESVNDAAFAPDVLATTCSTFC